MAENVTLIPGQIAPEGTAAMLTLAGNNGFTVIVIVLEVAGEPVAQIAFDVISTVIASAFASVVVVYVGFVAPEIFTPPFFH